MTGAWVAAATLQRARPKAAGAPALGRPSNAVFETLACPPTTACSCVAATRNLCSFGTLDYAMFAHCMQSVWPSAGVSAPGTVIIIVAPLRQQPYHTGPFTPAAIPHKTTRRLDSPTTIQVVATRRRLTAIRAPRLWQRLCASAGPFIGSPPAVLTAAMPSRPLIGRPEGHDTTALGLNILCPRCRLSAATPAPMTANRQHPLSASSAYAHTHDTLYRRPPQIRPCAPLRPSQSSLACSHALACAAPAPAPAPSPL